MKNLHHSASLFGAAALLGGLAFATPAALAAQPGSATSKKAGPAELYHEYCSVCHGDRGDGKSRAQNSFVRPPRDFTAPDARSIPRDYMLAVVRDGKPGTAMVGWKTQLSEAQIAAVVDHIREKMMGAPTAPATPAAPGQPNAARHADSVAPDMTLPFANNKLKGDARKGADLYTKNCATCHGAKGDGQGPRAYFINPKPRNFLLPTSRSAFNRPTLFVAISHGRNGSEMPAWNKVMTEQEIAHVAEYVLQAFIRPGQP